MQGVMPLLTAKTAGSLPPRSCSRPGSCWSCSVLQGRHQGTEQVGMAGAAASAATWAVRVCIQHAYHLGATSAGGVAAGPPWQAPYFTKDSLIVGNPWQASGAWAGPLDRHPSITQWSV